MKYHKKVWDANVSGLYWIMKGKFRTLSLPVPKVRGGDVTMGREFFLKEPKTTWTWIAMQFGVDTQWGMENLRDRKKKCDSLYKATGKRLMRHFYKEYPE